MEDLVGHFLIGLPGCGKSTFAAQLAPTINALIVSTDEIRAKLYGDESIQGNWADVEAEAIKQIALARDSNRPVIYDATNCKKEHRIDMLNKVAHLNYSWIAWFLNTPIEVCKHRNEGRSRQVPTVVIDAMAFSLASFPPSTEEGFIGVKNVIA